MNKNVDNSAWLVNQDIFKHHNNTIIRVENF